MPIPLAASLALLALQAAAAPDAGEAGEAGPRPVPRVLFIGNSYTYFNRTPELFDELARASGIAVEVESVVEGGATLRDHLEEGEALRRIRASSWDWVVLQEQSTLGTNRFHDGRAVMSDTAPFEAAAGELIEATVASGARPALFLTWAREGEPRNQAVLNRAYGAVARATGAALVPVGPAWMEARAEDPGLELYLEDGSHPAPLGSYLAACCLVATLFGRPPDDLPSRIELPAGDEAAAVRIESPAQQAATIHRAVAGVLARLAAGDPAGPEEVGAEPDLHLEADDALGPEAFEGDWRGSVPLLPAPDVSSLFLSIDAGAEVGVVVELDHAEGFLPDQGGTVPASLDAGLLSFQHPAEGFGTLIRYRLVPRDGALVGFLEHVSQGRTFFSARFRLERD